MSWQKIDVRSGDFGASYRAKYGLHSNYHEDQRLIYAHPEVKESFTTILTHFPINPAQHILDIGINNGYELNLIATHKPALTQTHVTGIDLAGDMLLLAKKEVPIKHLTLLEGDIRTFKGQNITTGQVETIADNSIDVLIALLSLQSTCLQDTLEIFLNTLVKKLKWEANLLIGIPDFHINEERQVKLGLFDAHTGQLDTDRARKVAETISTIFKDHGFVEDSIGSLVIFQHFSRI